MKLFLPGPVSVRSEVLKQFEKPVIGHRTKEASEVQKSISINMQKIFGTKEEILVSTSSGTGLMEGAIRSCTKKRALICSIGTFGDLWQRLGHENGIETDILRAEDGEVTDPNKLEEALKEKDYDFVGITHNETSSGILNDLAGLKPVIDKYPNIVWALDTVSSAGGAPIDQDKYGIDIAITSSQKCLSLVPGLSFASFSEKAVEKAKTVENRGHYLDLLLLYNYVKEHDYQYPSTPAISNMVAAEYQLNYIINEEGLENRFKRHEEMSKYFKKWADENFEIFGNKDHLSPTITCVKNTKDLKFDILSHEFMNKGFLISNGYGKLAGKTFRVGHMGDTSLDDIKEFTKTFDEILNK